MTIRAVRVTVACDRCGRVFSVALDEATKGLMEWAWYLDDSDSKEEADGDTARL
jgi:hypothetical protein